MADNSGEFNGKVNVGANGERFAAVKSEYGNIRMTDSPAIQQVNLCILDGSLKQQCLLEISYSKSAGQGVVPGLKVNNTSLIDMDALGPQLNEALKKALDGTKVSVQDANEIGRLSAEINGVSTRQHGVKLR